MGAPGAVAGVTLLDAAEAGPVPMAFVAVTVNVYAVPFVSPVTVAVSVLPPTEAVSPPGLDATVYPVIALPPLEAGATQVTSACAFPAVALTDVGAPGTVTATGVTLLDAVEAALVATALAAVTAKVYAVPLVSPVTVAVSVLPSTEAVSPPGLDVTV